MEFLCTVLLTILFNLHISEGKNHAITWTILSSPIVFGEDVVLYCNASLADNCCTNTATWMKDFDVIVHHGASTNTSKYIQAQGIDGFSLTIKNFNEEDINHQYTCLYDFLSYSAVLKMDKTNFEYIPRSNEIEVSINKTIDKMILADVMFEKVYPEPECLFVVNEKKIQTNVTVADKTQIGFFWKMRVHLVSDKNQSKCINTIAVNCTVGKHEMETETEMLECQDRITTFGSDENILDHTPVAIFSSVIICVVVIVGLLILKKLQLQCKKRKESSSQGDEIHSISSLDNDSEHVPLIQNPLDEDISSISSKDDCVPGDLDKNYPGDEIHSMSSLDNDSEHVPLIQNPLGQCEHIKTTCVPAQRNKDLRDILKYCVAPEQNV